MIIFKQVLVDNKGCKKQKCFFFSEKLRSFGAACLLNLYPGWHWNPRNLLTNLINLQTNLNDTRTITPTPSVDSDSHTPYEAFLKKFCGLCADLLAFDRNGEV